MRWYEGRTVYRRYRCMYPEVFTMIGKQQSMLQVSLKPNKRKLCLNALHRHLLSHPSIYLSSSFSHTTNLATTNPLHVLLSRIYVTMKPISNTTALLCPPPIHPKIILRSPLTWALQVSKNQPCSTMPKHLPLRYGNGYGARMHGLWWLKRHYALPSVLQ